MKVYVVRCEWEMLENDGQPFFYGTDILKIFESAEKAYKFIRSIHILKDYTLCDAEDYNFAVSQVPDKLEGQRPEGEVDPVMVYENDPEWSCDRIKYEIYVDEREVE